MFRNIFGNNDPLLIVKRVNNTHEYDLGNAIIVSPKVLDNQSIEKKYIIQLKPDTLYSDRDRLMDPLNWFDRADRRS